MCASSDTPTIHYTYDAAGRLKSAMYPDGAVVGYLGGATGTNDAPVAAVRETAPAASEKRFCMKCGTPAGPDDRFCLKCGTPLE